MRQAGGELVVDTTRAGLCEITREVVEWVAAQGMATGLLTVFCRHTSASLLIQENAAVPRNPSSPSLPVLFKDDSRTVTLYSVLWWHFIFHQRERHFTIAAAVIG